jgi:2-(1,2-epoxy-1,2-dihydrophenyl)acetyl-CoA isomerase
MTEQAHPSTTPLVAHRNGGVLTLTLNLPDRRNPLTPEMRRLLHERLQAAATDQDTRCIVITGAGRAFCAGGDVAKMGTRSPLETFEHLSGVRTLVEAMVVVPKPVVAAVNGAAVGAGLALALACDIVVATESAKFGLLFSLRGLVPDSGATYFVTQQIGRYRAKRWALTGELISAAQAAAWGLVSDVWPDDEFAERTRKLCDELAAGPTAALAMTKRLINQAGSADLSSALEAEALAQAVATSTADHQEGVAAFRERRAPSFRGR